MSRSNALPTTSVEKQSIYIREYMRGGKRPGAGRPQGSINRANRELRDIAQAYTVEAIETLAHIMRSAESDATRLSAANALLDRAHGRPTQTIDTPPPTDPAEMSEAELMAIIVQDQRRDEPELRGG
jgi:hypothetical protein